MTRYEHFVCDVTPAALHFIELAVDSYVKQFSNIKSETLVELENFRNDIRGRLQRAAVGDHSPAPPKPILNGDLI
jgi:hypothetical protein